MRKALRTISLINKIKYELCKTAAIFGKQIQLLKFCAPEIYTYIVHTRTKYIHNKTVFDYIYEHST